MEISGLELDDISVADSALEKNSNNNSVNSDGLAENDTEGEKEACCGARGEVHSDVEFSRFPKSDRHIPGKERGLGMN